MRLLTGHRWAVRAVAFAPVGEMLLASAADDLTIRLWHPATGEQVRTMDSRRDGFLCLAFSPDAKTLASGGRGGALTLWNVADGTVEPGNLVNTQGAFATVAFTPDARALLGVLRSRSYVEARGRLVCWNLVPRHPLEPVNWMGDIETAAIAPGLDLFALAGQQREVHLWEVGRSQQPPAFRVPSRVGAMTFSPDGDLLAVATGRIVQLWNVGRRQHLTTLTGHRGLVTALAVSPDGQSVLSGGGDYTARLWEVASGRELAAWDWKLGALNCVAISPDGMLAAAGGEKSGVVVWDLDE